MLACLLDKLIQFLHCTVVPVGEGECSGQFFDYLHVLDKCVVPKVWSLLK